MTARHTDSEVSDRSAPPTAQFAFLLLAGAVALAPLPFGSVDPVASCVWAVVLGLALLGAKSLPGRPLDPVLILLAVAAIIAYLIVLALQLDLAGAWRLPADPVWARAGKLLDRQLADVPAIVLGQPIFALLNPLISLLAMATAYLVCSDRNRARQLLLVIAVSGLVYAVVGFVFLVLLPDYVLWRQKYSHIGYLTATFMNRNTAAVYFAGCGLVWLLVAARHVGRYAEGRSVRKALKVALGRAPGKVLYPAAACAVCMQAVLWSGSRAGVVLALLGFLGTGAAYFVRRIRWRKFLMSIGGVLLIALVLAQFLGRDRFQEQGLSDPARLATYRATIALIADRPWIGHGLGSFAWSYPPYRSPDASIIGVWNRAHNVWLETAAEGGIPLATILAMGWIYILYRLGRGSQDRRRDRHIPLAAFGFVALGLIHALVDFSLQIPGFMIVLSAIAGAGLAQSVGRNPQTEPGSHPNSAN